MYVWYGYSRFCPIHSAYKGVGWKVIPKSASWSYCTLLSKGNTTFLKLHFFWGPRAQGHQENGQIKVVFLLEKCVGFHTLDKPLRHHYFSFPKYISSFYRKGFCLLSPHFPFDRGWMSSKVERLFDRIQLQDTPMQLQLQSSTWVGSWAHQKTP